MPELPPHVPITLPEIGGFRLVNAIGTPIIRWEILGPWGDSEDPVATVQLENLALLEWAVEHCDSALFLEAPEQ